MEITEIRIKLMEGSEDRLRAFCSITVDQAFVIRDLKIIDGTSGPFVAMPSRKLTGHCPRCGQKNHLRAGYCNHCGGKLSTPPHVLESPQKLYADVAHPINSECREMIQSAVIVEFMAELDRSRQPGYRSRYDDEFDAGDYDEADYNVPLPAASVTDPDDSFGAGLSERPSRVVRGEPKNTHAVPRPHFQDRAGGSRGPSVTSSPNPGGSTSQRPEPPTDDDFGAGIFESS